MTATILRADARHIPLPAASVDLIVTSPPYFGLRSYTDGGAHYDGQIGSEATPAAYVAALVACTREWMRVLKPSGSLFVNLGDKYSTGNSGDRNTDLNERWGNGSGKRAQESSQLRTGRVPGTQPKSLLGLPWRYALACIDDLGLILRAEIIWSKPNGLPESVTDRVRRSHEQLFHFTRLPRYYSAVDEIREPSSGYERPQNYARAALTNGTKPRTLADTCNPLGKLPGSVWDIPSQPLTVPPELGVDHFAAFPMELPRRIVLGWSPPGICTVCGEGRRPVVERGPSFLSAHPMPHPTAPDGDLRKQRARGQKHQDWINAHPDAITGYACACPQPEPPGPNCGIGNPCYGQSCAACYPDRFIVAPTRPAIVLDPFGGTGTTALVADMLGRTGISVDRSADYCRLARWRTHDPAQRAAAMQVPKPPPQVNGQGDMLELFA